MGSGRCAMSNHPRRPYRVESRFMGRCDVIGTYGSKDAAWEAAERLRDIEVITWPIRVVHRPTGEILREWPARGGSYGVPDRCPECGMDSPCSTLVVLQRHGFAEGGEQ